MIKNRHPFSKVHTPFLNHLEGAFSLAELLVTLAVTALLLVLLFPVVKKGMEKVRSVQCVSNLKVLYSGCLAYAADHEMEIVCDRTNPHTAITWYVPLKDEGYLPHPGFGCKEAPYFCPGNPAPAPEAGAPGFTNYAFNSNLNVVNTSLESDGDDPDFKSKRANFRFHQLKKVKALLLDSYNESRQLPDYATEGDPWSQISAVHGVRVNVLFTDGHIESPRVTPRTSNAAHDLNELKQEWFIIP